MKTAAAFGAGLLFSAGLFISGMTQPTNIIGFLDFFGAWKPALLFVMAGALGAYALLFPIVTKQKAPLFAPSFDLPTNKKIDFRLIAGAVTFGIGWGIGGFCPGPALVALGSGAKEALIFVSALLVGVFLYRLASQSGQAASDDADSCG